MQKSQVKKGNQTVPVQLKGGITAYINPMTIPEERWEHHHGKTAGGQKVNSLKTTQIDDSILIRNGTGGPTFSTPMADFEVSALQVLAGIGYKFQPPTGN